MTQERERAIDSGGGGGMIREEHRLLSESRAQIVRFYVILMLKLQRKLEVIYRVVRLLPSELFTPLKKLIFSAIYCIFSIILLKNYYNTESVVLFN